MPLQCKAFITVMKTAELWDCDDPASGHLLIGAVRASTAARILLPTALELLMNDLVLAVIGCWGATEQKTGISSLRHVI
jgi:hypothetical protein